MYCPNCATRLAETATRCLGCGLGVAPVARLLRDGREDDAAAADTRRWGRRRRALGTLTVLCSLLLGCFIPISIGLLGGQPYLGSIILVLAGLAGVLLLVGSMLIMAADGVILTSAPPAAGDDRQPPRSAQAERAYALPASDSAAQVAGREERVARR